MKKSYILLLFTLSSSIFTLLKAQSNAATPDAGFEYWTHVSSNGGYDDPDSSWACLNPSTAITGDYTCFKDSINVHSGRYAAHLLTQSIFTITAPGALTTGSINTTNYTINGGLPYTLRPDSMIGWYEYTSANADNGDCEFYLFGATHADTIGIAFFRTPTSNVSTYTRFALPITYLSSSTPDTALWIFSSSTSQAGAQVGSQLWVDDLGLIFNNTTGVNNITDAKEISVGPNPSSGLLSINNYSNSPELEFTLVDVTGRKIEENKLAAGTNNMELTNIPDGVYIYSILDEQNSVVKTGKIVVQR